MEVLAESATAPQLAARLGQALGKPTASVAGLEDRRLTFYLPDVTVAELDRFLISRMQIHVVESAGVVEVHGGTPPDLFPIETRIIPVTGKATAEQLAAAFCRTVASSDGHAQVVGDDLLVSDRRPRLDRFEVIVRVARSGQETR